MENPRIIIWFVSTDGRFIGNAVNILTRQFSGVDIIGVTAGQKISVNNLPFIPLNEISMNGGGYDVLLVAGAKNIGMAEVTKFAKSIKLDADKLLGDWIVCIPGFTLEKYRQLQRSQLSIFSRNCFGGLISNTLGLPFRSPFVNLFLGGDDFIKFLKYPRIYIEETPKFEKLYGTSNEAPNGYPVFSLGNVLLYMMHYPNADEALNKWNERKQRINWYNIMVIMEIENEELLEKFNALPYGKKVCFVRFKSELESAFYINKNVVDKFFNRTVDDWEVWGKFAQGQIFLYDVFDMLLYGKKTPLIDMD